MKTEIIYSFVIPHRNTPNLLQRLIDSIPQREDIEIIVVDDNSDEGKKANISRPDVRTIYIDKEHSQGAGKARNVGMDAAKGKWLLFADADDFYKSGFIDVLDEYKDDDIEMLFYNIDSVDSDTLQPNNRANPHQKLITAYDGESQKAIDDLLFFGYGPWRRMLKSDYVKVYGFQYEETLKANDLLFALSVSYFAKKWKVDTRVVYTLTCFKGSITYSRLTKLKCLAHFNALRRRAKLYSFIGHPEWNFKCCRGFFFQSCLFFCYRQFKKNPLEGIRAFMYYITNWYEIKKGENYYVEVVKRLTIDKN